MITILDYGLGNVLAFQNVYKRLGIGVAVAGSADALDDATKLILPGVGAFDHAMSRFSASGLREAAEELVLGRGVPIMGICVGMQMLADGSDEGDAPGLGWVPGRVRKLSAAGRGHATGLPHMGWNDVRPVQPSELFHGLDGDARFYFLHSFYFEPATTESTLAVTEYGQEFTSAISAGHVYGVQFHPEKSHHHGSRLLQNFAERV